MIIVRLFNTFQDWRRNREAVRELAARSDRELSDIGLLRADIEAAVRGGLRNARA